MRETPPSQNNGARAEVVSRTHRVVRQRAHAINSRREFARSLWIPLMLCSVLLLTLGYGGWTMMSPIDAGSDPAILSSEPGSLMPVLLMWFLPLTIAAGAVMWFRSVRSSDDERRRG